MINLSFVRGSSLRRVLINEKRISFMTQETGFMPIVVDLEKIDEKEISEKMGGDGLEFIKEISKLDTEEKVAKDITKDFQRTGWRCIKKE